MNTTVFARALVLGALALASSGCNKGNKSESSTQQPGAEVQVDQRSIAQDDPAMVAVPPDTDNQDELVAPPPPAADDGDGEDSAEPPPTEPVEAEPDDETG